MTLDSGVLVLGLELLTAVGLFAVSMYVAVKLLRRDIVELRTDVQECKDALEAHEEANEPIRELVIRHDQKLQDHQERMDRHSHNGSLRS